MNKINEQIKRLRKNSGLTQVEFSKRSGVGLRFLRELEQGKTTVRLDKVNQVLEFLGHHLEIGKDDRRMITKGVTAHEDKIPEGSAIFKEIPEK
ncbi:MAG: helix-turn-helix transcriptional regulator [Candidatus Omnitrophica bacterium]|nr:helix-turn-helix transcriptional regulator [Candidatus Omnitrophota bacterium]MCB9748036.1 helix-turn-helix transcriptional regulator [Candidatus Omnitrophota bacterium]